MAVTYRSTSSPLSFSIASMRDGYAGNRGVLNFVVDAYQETLGRAICVLA